MGNNKNIEISNWDANGITYKINKLEKLLFSALIDICLFHYENETVKYREQINDN